MRRAATEVERGVIVLGAPVQLLSSSRNMRCRYARACMGRYYKFVQGEGVCELSTDRV